MISGTSVPCTCGTYVHTYVRPPDCACANITSAYDAPRRAAANLRELAPYIVTNLVTGQILQDFNIFCGT